MDYKDYYKILGVTKSATADELKSSFRKLARRYHPDVAKDADKAQAESKFKEINEAYEVLSDPAKRAQYDELGSNWQSGGGMPGGGAYRRSRGGAGQPGSFEFDGTGFSDFFEQFFGSSQRGGRGAYRSSPFEQYESGAAGRDLEVDFLIRLDDAHHGAARKISLRREGSDKVETYEVKIPAGIQEGQKIRLSGRGGPGIGTGGPGDLFLNVRFERHPFFRFEDGDLVYDVPLAPWEAVLGCEKEVRSFQEKLRLKIPQGTQSGRKFRFKNLGMRKKDGSRSDLYAVVDIEIPRQITPAERNLWESFAELQDGSA